MSLSEDQLNEMEARRWIAHPGDASRRAEATVQTLVGEVRRLQAALTRSEQAHAADAEVCAEVRGLLRADNGRLRASLAHYADEVTWKENARYDRYRRTYRGPRGQDGWEVARAALGTGAADRRGS